MGKSAKPRHVGLVEMAVREQRGCHPVGKHHAGHRPSQQPTQKQLVELHLQRGRTEACSAEPCWEERRKARTWVTPDQVRLSLFMRSFWTLSDWKPFSAWAPWGNTQNPKRRMTMTTTTTTTKLPKPGECPANWQGPQSSGTRTGELPGSSCLQSSQHIWRFSRGDRTVYRKPFVTGACLPAAPGDVLFLPHLSSAAYLAPGRPQSPSRLEFETGESQTPRPGQTVPPSILEPNFREFWFYLHGG